MATVTLKALHQYLRLLENASELKRRLPVSANQRTLKEGLGETSRLVGVEESVFHDPQNIAAMIGAQRFVMIWGEPSVTDHVARIFDNSRVLLTGLVAAVNSDSANARQTGPGTQPGGATAGVARGSGQPNSEPLGSLAQSNAERDAPLDGLKTLLWGNAPLSSRLFRALFEHLLGFVLKSSATQASASLVSDLTGSKEHSRSFLSTALYILGAEIDHDHVMSFMMEQGLFGMPIFEHLLQNREYCEAFYSFRRLERAFVSSPVAEETHLRQRLDTFNAQFGGNPYGAKIFEADGQDKAKVDAYLAAADLLEALALTPWCISLNNAVATASSHSIRSVSLIARHFERFGRGEITKDQANQEVADHLMAFARQFSADTKAS